MTSRCAIFCIVFGLSLLSGGFLFAQRLPGSNPHAKSVSKRFTRGNMASTASQRLMNATILGRADEAGMLLAQGTNPNLRDERGWTPLMDAAIGGELKVVKVLLRYKADPTLQEPERGGRALDMAASHPDYVDRRAGKYIEVIRLLLSAGARVNAKDKKGNTALIGATVWGNMPVVKLLLSRGARIRSKNAEGKTALDFAVRKTKVVGLSRQRAAIKSLLIQAGANQ